MIATPAAPPGPAIRPRTLRDELECRRLEHRAARLDAAIARLEALADDAADRGEPVPVPLRAALSRFRADRARIDGRLADLAA